MALTVNKVLFSIVSINRSFEADSENIKIVYQKLILKKLFIQ